MEVSGQGEMVGMIEIKHKETWEVLHTVDADTLEKADLSCLDKADLSDANLRGARLIVSFTKF